MFEAADIGSAKHEWSGGREALSMIDLDAERQLLLQTIRQMTEHTRFFDVELHLSDPRFLSWAAGAAFRGLVGWLFQAEAPDLLESVFKPGNGGHAQSGFAIRNLDLTNVRRPVFRLTLFGNPEETPERIRELLRKKLPGVPFGETGICSVLTGEILSPAEFRLDDYTFSMTGEFRFETPVRLKRHKEIVNAAEFSLAHLASGAAERLMALGRQFCGLKDADMPDPSPLVMGAALATPLRRSIRWLSQSRISDVSGKTVCMDGCGGSFLYSHIPRETAMLLEWGASVNLGKLTSAGCGAYSVHWLRNVTGE